MSLHHFATYQMPPELQTALKAAAGQRLSQYELFEQRVSFVYGSLRHDHPATKEQIRQALREQMGTDFDPVRTHGNR